MLRGGEPPKKIRKNNAGTWFAFAEVSFYIGKRKMENLTVSSQVVSQSNNTKTANAASNVDQSNSSSAADAAPEKTAPETFGKILAQQVASSKSSKDEGLVKSKTKDTVVSALDMTSAGVGNQILFVDPNALPMQKLSASNASSTAVSQPVFADGALGAASPISGKELPVGNLKPADIAATIQTSATSDLSKSADPKALTQSFDLMLAEKDAASQQNVSSQSGGPVSQTLTPLTMTTDQKSNADQTTLAVPQRVGAEDWGSGLGDKVVWMVGNQTRGAEIHLNPPALGPLEVRISITDGQANLSFMAHNASVREAIEAATPRLREMLGDTGISMGNVSVDVGSFSQQQPQQQQQASSSDRSSNPNAWIEASGDTDTSVSTFTTIVQPSRGRGMVDYFA